MAARLTLVTFVASVSSSRVIRVGLSAAAYPPTIQYYEEIGLVKPAGRASGGQLTIVWR
jgi:hypothetical protein